MGQTTETNFGSKNKTHIYILLTYMYTHLRCSKEPSMSPIRYRNDPWYSSASDRTLASPPAVSTASENLAMLSAYPPSLTRLMPPQNATAAVSCAPAPSPNSPSAGPPTPSSSGRMLVNLSCSAYKSFEGGGVKMASCHKCHPGSVLVGGGVVDR